MEVIVFVCFLGDILCYFICGGGFIVRVSVCRLIGGLFRELGKSVFIWFNIYWFCLFVERVVLYYFGFRC